MNKNQRKYQICKKTIMDTSDPNIIFDDAGVSDYYHNFKNFIEPNWKTNDVGYNELMKTADKIKRDGKNRDFDCIIGVSGGLDSSYTAYVAKEIMDLNPLIFHVDAGWNTQSAVSNIEKLINGLQVDLWPRTAALNALATEGAKQRKFHIPIRSLLWNVTCVRWPFVGPFGGSDLRSTYDKMASK